MGRKKKTSMVGQTGVPHKEAFQRMNYLFQAALAALSTSPSEPGLSRFYIRTMKTIGKRLVLRMDPSVKRMLCKSCDSLLVAGVTCTHRLKCRRNKHIVVRCLTCGSLKRFLSNNDYLLWTERTENISPTPATGQEQAATSSPGQPSRVEPPKQDTQTTERPKVEKLTMDISTS